MYTIQQAANMLNADLVDIKEIMILFEKTISSHVYNMNGVIHIDDKALDIIHQAFKNKNNEKKAEENKEHLEEKTEAIEPIELLKRQVLRREKDLKNLKEQINIELSKNCDYSKKLKELQEQISKKIMRG